MGEVQTGLLRQIYVKQWSGSTWTLLAGNGGGIDTTPPSVPTNLTAAAGSNAITLAWSGSTDIVGVTGYAVFRNGLEIGISTAAISYQDTNVTPGVAYTYTVAAYDAAGNISVQSAPLTASTSNSAAHPIISITAPSSGATVSGSVTLTANATSSIGVAGVQFQIDGSNFGSMVTGSGSTYSLAWNTAAVTNGSHTIGATATDTAGNTGTASAVTVRVSNAAVISGVSAGSITSTGATITWTTNTPSSSQVDYGTTVAYGSLSALNSTLVTAHVVTLTGLTAGTGYHYQVKSEDAQGNLVSSGDFRFTTATTGGTQTVLVIQGNGSEVSGAGNGAVVTPSTAPLGFTGITVVNGSGSINFVPAQVGNGVYFLNCCANANNAYYKFNGATIGDIFNVNSGQVSFYLKSRYSFAQRVANAAAPRYAFDVRDGSGNHLFYFLTQVSSDYLNFTYMVGGTAEVYFVPQGTEDALYGNEVTLQVTLNWSGNTANLYLNSNLVKSTAYTAPTANWSAASNFDLGAYEYVNAGGYNESDDVINEFTVTQ